MTDKMHTLPKLKETAAPQRRQELFVEKLKLCEVQFHFDTEEERDTDKRGKELKRDTLLELVDFVSTAQGQKVFTEPMFPKVLDMVGANIFRALPPQQEDFDAEEDEPVLEPSWPHMQVVYEFLLRFIVSGEVVAKVAKKYVNHAFCSMLIQLFDSEDPRERDYLKTILHRIYGKFMPLRSFLRSSIRHVFYTFVYETQRHNGIGELLEILGSIINGFALPLKKEHLIFMKKALLPLHKPKCVSLYHQQLSYCVTQFVEKDPLTAVSVINALAKYWPWSCSAKMVHFLNELEEILELITEEVFDETVDVLFDVIGRCVSSDHFQVAERALFLWNNEQLVKNGILNKAHAAKVLPRIFGHLSKNNEGHWNSTVEELTQNVFNLYIEYDIGIYEKCQSDYLANHEEDEKAMGYRKDLWATLDNE